METIGRDLREMQRIPLQPEHIAAIRAAGIRTHYLKGTMLAEIGAPADRFFYVEEGKSRS
jgi:thioredoxin reductase (NADPH)